MKTVRFVIVAALLAISGCGGEKGEHATGHPKKWGKERIRHIGMFRDYTHNIPWIDHRFWIKQEESGTEKEGPGHAHTDEEVMWGD